MEEEDDDDGGEGPLRNYRGPRGNRKEEEEEKEKEASPGSALQHRGTCLLESIFPPVPGLGWGGGERVKERWEEEWSKRKRRATFLPSRRSEAPL